MKKLSNTLIIYCHPYDKSFSHAVLSEALKPLAHNQTGYRLLDLYADNFNPIYDEQELQLYASGATTDPLVTRYLAALKEADQLIIITPIWWNDLPAMLKGFFDKVMKRGPELAYTSTSRGVAGHLDNIKSALVLTTSTSPTVYQRLFCGDAIKRILIGATLKQLGIQNVKWHNFGGITAATVEKRRTYLTHVGQWVNRLS